MGNLFRLSLSVDTFVEAVSASRLDVMSELYNCEMGTRYISLNASIATDVQFESGVVKIQRNELSSLNTVEIEAFKSLNLSTSATDEHENP